MSSNWRAGRLFGHVGGKISQAMQSRPWCICEVVIAISSFKPLDLSAEIALNQIRAHKTWSKAFDAIIYFGKHEPRLECPKTSFILHDDFPTISLMALTASMTGDWACIINSDIVVSPMLIPVWDQAVRRGAKAVTSYRWEYDEDDLNLLNARVVDNGFDFFATTPDLWGRISLEVPASYRIGHNVWDSWTLGFLNTVLGRKFFDITSQRVIFHPRHGNREQKWPVVNEPSAYVALSGAPFSKL